MTSQIPPEPPDGALVIVKSIRTSESPNRVVVAAYQRDGSQWFPVGQRQYPVGWEALYRNFCELYIYVATEFVDLWRYNGMEYPK